MVSHPAVVRIVSVKRVDTTSSIILTCKRIEKAQILMKVTKKNCTLIFQLHAAPSKSRIKSKQRQSIDMRSRGRALVKQTSSKTEKCDDIS